jgi:hypothetical protein
MATKRTAGKLDYTKLRGDVDRLESKIYEIVQGLEDAVDPETDQFPEFDDELNEMLQLGRKVQSDAGELAHLSQILPGGVSSKDYKPEFSEHPVSEPDHERILAEIRRQLDFYKGQDPVVYKEYEDNLRALMQSYTPSLAGGTVTKGSFSEPSVCPVIPEAAEMINRSAKFMAEKHPQDTNDAEVASIGHDYTYHTHPRGTPQPSEADINTTTQLGKRFLCIGLVPNKEVICYDLQMGGVACKHPA